jgi:hypothetical protein
MSSTPIIGIYALFFELDDNRYYVGKSFDILARYRAHLSKLKCGTHSNTKLLNAFNVIGKLPSLYVLEEMSTATDSALSEREIFWIAELDAFKHGFNNSLGGEGYSGEYSPHLLKDKANYIDFVRLLASGKYRTIKQAAAIADIPYDSARDICAGKSCTWISKYALNDYLLVLSNTGNRYTHKEEDHKYLEVLRCLATGNLNMKGISDSTGVSYNTVRSIACGVTHKYLQELYPEEYSRMKYRKRGNGSSKYLT